MVQLLLSRSWGRTARRSLVAACVAMQITGAWASPKSRRAPATVEMWEMSLEGGRRLTWVRNFGSEAEVKPNRGFWTKVLDIVAGEPEFRSLVRPYSIATDSRGRIIVTDPGAQGIHIFDFVQHKYRFIEHKGKSHDEMLTPQCVAVDGQDNIYVTDSDAGLIFEFDPGGKYLRTIGRLKGGEGYFQRPTGIAVDSAAQRIYVSDTLRNKVLILDLEGHLLRAIGQKGQANGEFYYPTELRLNGTHLLVVDAMNFRVQAFDQSGNFEYSIGKAGDSTGAVFRPKAVSVDSEGDIYIVDSLWGAVQVFDRKGELLYYFGAPGTNAGEFQLPTGLYIDRQDRVFVVDSFNRRIQEFQYAGVKPLATEEMK